MPDSHNGTSKELRLGQQEIVRDMHKLFLEALRLREQQIIRYLVILGPGLGGFIWLLSSFRRYSISADVFVAGTVGIIFLLGIGAAYALALGYNYRYIIFLLAKIESRMQISDFYPTAWPSTLKDFSDPKKNLSKPKARLYVLLEIIMALLYSFCPTAWSRTFQDRRDEVARRCVPPEIIKVFWISFLIGILLVAGGAIFVTCHFADSLVGIIIIAVTSLIAGIPTGVCLPIAYGRKLASLYAKDDPAEW